MSHSLKVDGDVFSCILSFIFESRAIYTILRAIPASNPLFSVTLDRLCRLPIHLSSDSTDSLNVVDLLLSTSTSSSTPASSAIVHGIRHLILSLGSDYQSYRLNARLPDLFRNTTNLQILDWRGEVGLSEYELHALQRPERLRTLRLDASVRRSDWK